MNSIKLPNGENCKVELLAAKVDTGDAGRPGSGASEHIAKLYISANGWRAESYAETGSNQGYFESHYSYGPWRASGRSAREAVSRMMNAVDLDWRDKILVASEGALSEVDNRSWGDFLRREIERLEARLKNDINLDYVQIFGSRYLEKNPDMRRKMREVAIAACNSELSRLGAPLSKDDAILFMKELLDSVETLTGIAEEHGAETLADLMYLQSAILNSSSIEVPSKSGLAAIVGSLPSAEKWSKFIEYEDALDGHVTPRG